MNLLEELVREQEEADKIKTEKAIDEATEDRQEIYDLVKEIIGVDVARELTFYDKLKPMLVLHMGKAESDFMPKEPKLTFIFTLIKIPSFWSYEGMPEEPVYLSTLACREIDSDFVVEVETRATFRTYVIDSAMDKGLI